MSSYYDIGDVLVILFLFIAGGIVIVQLERIIRAINKLNKRRVNESSSFSFKNRKESS